jgi:LmbE family N-acetylglucosaminyl deacetylase
VLAIGLDWTKPRLGHVLCLGAHCDDIEIGCGGTMAKLADEHPGLSVTWVVWSSNARRAEEARASAEAILAGVKSREIVVNGFRDGFLPYHGAQVKEAFEELKKKVTPDLIFTHYRSDLHQDHRLVSELTWNTFRGPLILEYEIPKWDGDLGQPNAFVPLAESHVARKIEILMAAYETQLGRSWFEPETFRSLLRLRGMEAAAPERYAEAFYARKLVLGSAR